MANIIAGYFCFLSQYAGRYPKIPAPGLRPFDPSVFTFACLFHDFKGSGAVWGASRRHLRRRYRKVPQEVILLNPFETYVQPCRRKKVSNNHLLRNLFQRIPGCFFLIFWDFAGPLGRTVFVFVCQQMNLFEKCEITYSILNDPTSI